MGTQAPLGTAENPITTEAEGLAVALDSMKHARLNGSLVVDLYAEPAAAVAMERAIRARSSTSPGLMWHLARQGYLPHATVPPRGEPILHDLKADLLAMERSLASAMGVPRRAVDPEREARRQREEAERAMAMAVHLSPGVLSKLDPSKAIPDPGLVVGAEREDGTRPLLDRGREVGKVTDLHVEPIGIATGRADDDGMVPVGGWTITNIAPAKITIGEPGPATRELDVFLDGEPLARLNLTAGTVALMQDEARAAEVLLAELLEEAPDLSEGGVLDLRESVFAEAPVVLFPDGTWDLVPIDGQEPYQPDEASRSFWSAVGAAFAAVPGWAWRRS